jgi:(p)ppGpp synthase/HD superfamily hydrolase
MDQKLNFSYAQTNIQLYRQLTTLGKTSLEDLLLVQRSYKLATFLFSGRYRSSGKTFVAHSVGTASVLAALGADAEIIAAGLLHSAYTLGDFGGSWPSTDPKNRDVVVGAVGPVVEDYVYGYANLHWSLEKIQGYSEKFHELSTGTKTVLVIRLANEVEDYLDLGMLYASKDRPNPHMSLSQVMCRLANQLGHPFLAKELDRVFQETDNSEVDEILRAPPSVKTSYVIPPGTNLKNLLKP